jgi:hypothetical protein
MRVVCVKCEAGIEGVRGGGRGRGRAETGGGNNDQVTVSNLRREESCRRRKQR